MKTLASVPTTPLDPGPAAAEAAFLLDGRAGLETARAVVRALEAVLPARLAVRSAAPSAVPGTPRYLDESSPFTGDVAAARRAVGRLAAADAAAPTHGLAIQSAVDELAWTPGPGALRLLVAAGGAPFDEGPIDPAAALGFAAAAGVAIVLSFAGDPRSWAAATWRRAAEAAGVALVPPDRLAEAVARMRTVAVSGSRRSPGPARSRPR